MSPRKEIETELRGEQIDRRGFITTSIKSGFAALGLSLLGKRSQAATDSGVQTFQAKFNNPYDVVVSDDRLFYVSDSGNYSIKILDQNGRMIGQFGKPGSSGGNLNYPKGLAFDPDGNLAVVDSNNGRIAVFSREGGYIRSVGKFGGFTGAFFTPESLDFDEAGRLMVADTRAHRVQVLDYETGASLANLGGIGEDPPGISEGSLEYRFRLPTSVRFAGDGRIYVVDSKHGEIKVIDMDGRFLLKFSRSGTADGDLNFPTSLCVSPSGDVFVTDTGNKRVQKFDRTGRFIAKVDKIFDKPCGIFPTVDGRLAVVDNGKNELILIREF
jgi:DNA-binding beta-propeller fold protein YncE